MQQNIGVPQRLDHRQARNAAILVHARRPGTKAHVLPFSDWLAARITGCIVVPAYKTNLFTGEMFENGFGMKLTFLIATDAEVRIKNLVVLAPTALFTTFMLELKTLQMIDSKTGRGGGCWLMEKGRARAEKLSNG